MAPHARMPKGLTAIPTQIDLTVPRTIGQILDTAFRLYARMPFLFMFLAGIIVVPYELIKIIVDQGKHISTSTELILLLADLALVNPFISALEMQALIDVGEGRRPQIRDVIRRGVLVLPVVAAAQIAAGLSEIVGFLIFVIPGIYLGVRLAVAAPVAASEHTNWPDAIRRSLWLTRGNFWRVLGVLAIQGLLTYLVALIVGNGSSVAPTIVGLALAVLAQSFCTLLINLLYFDLRARGQAVVA